MLFNCHPQCTSSFFPSSVCQEPDRQLIVHQSCLETDVSHQGFFSWYSSCARGGSSGQSSCRLSRSVLHCTTARKVASRAWEQPLAISAETSAAEDTPGCLGSQPVVARRTPKVAYSSCVPERSNHNLVFQGEFAYNTRSANF